jgi:pimeloyl-ACP methyl ester carboxylesterase
VKRILLALISLCPSCAWIPRPASVPVTSLEAGKSSSSEMVVFLPGRWSHVEEFEREKFFEMAGKRWPTARLVALDLHIGYYKNRSMAERIHHDVVLPARAAGVKTLRFVGISMGGMGALIYDVEHPGQVDELILLSPFLGKDDALREIEAAGGALRWKPGAVSDEDFTRRLWSKLREKWLLREDRPDVWLGCGFQDRLAPQNRQFAKDFLKPEETRWQDGGHDWPTWRGLLQSRLER